jgi:hypothetical protein
MTNPTKPKINYSQSNIIKQTKAFLSPACYEDVLLKLFGDYKQDGGDFCCGLTWLYIFTSATSTTYSFFEPNNPNGEENISDLNTLFSKIFCGHLKDKTKYNKPHPIGISVFSRKQDEKLVSEEQYSNQGKRENFIKNLFIKIPLHLTNKIGEDNNIRYTAALIATFVGAHECLEYFLEKDKENKLINICDKKGWSSSE